MGQQLQVRISRRVDSVRSVGGRITAEDDVKAVIRAIKKVARDSVRTAPDGRPFVTITTPSGKTIPRSYPYD